MGQSEMIRGMLLGAGLMYLMDPDRGPRRRAMLRDQGRHLLHDLEHGLSAATRDLEHRSAGMLAEAKHRVTRGEAADPVVVARVRAELGRLTSHPGAIHVACADGVVTLSGPVLEAERAQVAAGVAKVRGVKQVMDRLEAHAEPGSVPALQGGRTRTPPRMELMQDHWAPATRLLVGALGGLAIVRGGLGGGAMGTLAGLAGVGMLARSVTNLPTHRLLGVDAGRRAVDVHKTVNVDAPLDEVWNLWSRFENFPRFMSHLKEVRRTGTGLSHWVAEAPGGATVEWDAVTTDWVPNERIAWKSVAGATVGNAGTVTFRENPGGGTRIEVRMSYNPPAGALGHALASLFGADPRHALDDDLMRLKSLLELGRTTGDAGRVTREDLGLAPAAAPHA